jgi:hypothetical protein
MTTNESAGEALFLGPLPQGFTRRVFRIAAGLELGFELCRVSGAIVVVEEGELELECGSGTRRRFGPGSMIPIARVPVTRARNVGPGPLALVFVSRARLGAADEFLRDAGSYSDC